jgi:hypothetical protein
MTEGGKNWKHYSRCSGTSEDCFNCPYPDCIATADDINRQDAEAKARQRQERTDEIVRLWNEGEGQYKIEDIAKRYDMTVHGIMTLLRTQRKKGVYVWQSNRSKLQEERNRK